MIHAIKILLAQFKYLTIRHREKTIIDFVLPFILSLISIILIIILPCSIIIIGENGLTFIIAEISKILIGFYIAFLIAVNTMSAEALNEKFEGRNPPYYYKKIFGNKKKILPNRREFLSFLFGYLAKMSILLYAISSLSNYIKINIIYFLTHIGCLKYLIYIKYILLFMFLLFTYNVLTTTLLGLYYMSQRLYREDNT